MQILRLLALACVALAAFCIALAVAWKREHDTAECWRAAFEDDEIPAGGDCRQPILPARAIRPATS
jgi:hypothetical protein